MNTTYQQLYFRSHPPMAAMQQWALEHGFYWPHCPGWKGFDKP